MLSVKDQKELVHFLNIHGLRHASSYNTIDAIITPFPITDELIAIESLLKKECVFLPYTEQNQDETFLFKLVHYLKNNKTIFIPLKGVQFSRQVLDEFYEIRLRNTITIGLQKQIETIEKEISIGVDSKIFLLIKEGTISMPFLSQITDHILYLPNTNI